MSDRYIVLACQQGNSFRVECKYKNSSGQGVSWTHSGELISFSENSVTFKNGSTIYTYDADQHQIASHSA